MNKYDLVDKVCYDTDPYHAPYETITAETPTKAKSQYHKMYPEYKYIDVLCRKSRLGSYNLIY